MFWKCFNRLWPDYQWAVSFSQNLKSFPWTDPFLGPLELHHASKHHLPSSANTILLPKQVGNRSFRKFCPNLFNISLVGFSIQRTFLVQFCASWESSRFVRLFTTISSLRSLNSDTHVVRQPQSSLICWNSDAMDPKRPEFFLHSVMSQRFNMHWNWIFCKTCGKIGKNPFCCTF